MSEYATFARPYAKALYQLAKQEGRIDQWDEFLRSLSEILSLPEVKALTADPRIDDDQLAGLLGELFGRSLTNEELNLIKLLVENDRLRAVPDMAAMFEQLRNLDQGLIEAEVISAKSLSESEQQTLKAALEKRLGRHVALHTRLDESLIGGVMIRANDLVIDGSLKGRLEQLARAMSR